MVKNAFIILCIILSKVCIGQNLAPTMSEALLKVKVTDLDNNPSEGEIITFVDKQSQNIYEGITDEEGSFEILIPKGHTYIIRYKNFGYDHQYAEHEIPDYEGKLVSKINIKYRLPSKTVLEDVFFEDDNITLSPGSFRSLDKLVELLKIKQSTHIRLAAHSDSKGDANEKQKLTVKQAESARNYLLSKGIPIERVDIIGYGDQYPMASNETPQGRAKNRRIEIEIMKK